MKKAMSSTQKERLGRRYNYLYQELLQTINPRLPESKALCGIAEREREAESIVVLTPASNPPPPPFKSC